jgi:hypothetical protein
MGALGRRSCHAAGLPALGGRLLVDPPIGAPARGAALRCGLGFCLQPGLAGLREAGSLRATGAIRPAERGPFGPAARGALAAHAAFAGCGGCAAPAAPGQRRRSLRAGQPGRADGGQRSPGRDGGTPHCAVCRPARPAGPAAPRRRRWCDGGLLALRGLSRRAGAGPPRGGGILGADDGLAAHGHRRGDAKPIRCTGTVACWTWGPAKAASWPHWPRPRPI